MPDLLDLEMLTVVGKGGVGRTTATAAMAMAAARRGKRVLIAMCNAKERLSHLVGVPPIDARIRQIMPSVDAVNMTPAASFEEYGMMILKVRALYRAIFENRFVSAFLHAVPGMDAWTMLGKAQFHAHEMLPIGRKRYDLVILDAPATGHGLEMLRVPGVICDAAPPSLLRTEADKAMKLLMDPRRSGMVIVTLPEEMPVAESVELYRTLEGELRMPTARLIVNGVIEDVFDEGERALLTPLTTQRDPSSPLAPLIRAAELRLARERVQNDAIGRLRQSIPVGATLLPLLYDAELDRKSVEKLSHAFDA